MKTVETPMSAQKVVSKEEWLQARIALLAKEKELTRRRDELSLQRRELPWFKVEKEYVFDAPQGKVTLATCWPKGLCGKIVGTTGRPLNFSSPASKGYRRQSVPCWDRT